MKIKLLLFTTLIVISAKLNAQVSGSPFRTGYIRLGINTLGKGLDNNLTPKENVFDGRYGAGTGYIFEFGRLFYFQKRSPKQRVNFGLDWTILSFSYNNLKKWDDYKAATSNTAEVDISGTKIAATVSSKLGPTVSFNPIEKLVIDVRFQVVPTFSFFDLDYNENYPDGKQRSFSFINRGAEDENEDYNAESVKNRVAFGVRTGLGVTVRRGVVGLSLDYLSGKSNINYDAFDGQGGHSFGKEKAPLNNLQLKFSLAF